MQIWKKWMSKNFFIKLRNWEYWPFGIVHLPAILYYIWLSIRSRSLFFFSASNPGIPMGGMLGESKFNILKKIPEQYIPKTKLVTLPASKEEVLTFLQENEFTFPVIFKPDLGERGFMVKKIGNEKEIESYLKRIKVDFIIQELINLPIELGVFYMRFPGRKTGSVTSIVRKEMLHVTGDGKSTLQALILKKDRAKLQWDALKVLHKENLNKVLLRNETIELVSIGNHCLGTKFLDGGYLINDQLSLLFDNISNQIDGFFFGRFDLRCASIEHLYQGKIKIMELNGCGAEPAHIYHPGYPLHKAMAVLVKHWRNIFLIARENRRQGIRYVSAKEAFRYYKAFKSALR
jgi:hypothetical protein